MSQADHQLGLLIASPQMRDPNFSQTVILICQHDEDGAIGLVINRDGPVNVGTVVARMNLDRPGNAEAPTWWGGPVGPGTGFVIWEGEGDPEEGWNLPSGVAVSPSADRLSDLVSSSQVFHLCLGYSGWGPGQLAGEIASGSWLYADVDSSIVFKAPLADRYDLALALLGLTAGGILMEPIEA